MTFTHLSAKRLTINAPAPAPAPAPLRRSGGTSVIPSIALAILVACSRGEPTTGHLSGAVDVIEVSPPSTTMPITGSIRFSATPKDSAGVVLVGREITWSTGSSAIATVDNTGLVTARGTGGTTITATSEGRSGTAALTVTTQSGPGLGVPVYSASNPQHVLHAFEDWSTYPTIAAIGTTNRVDGGGPWQNPAPELKTFSPNVDPWFGRKAVEINFQVAGNQVRGFHLAQSGSPARYLNVAQAQPSLVIEWAMRQAGTGIYVGKQADFIPGGSLYRFDFQNSWDRLGFRSNPTCDADPLCSYYYTNNGQTPRVATTPPDASMFGDQFARSFSDGGGTGVHHWNQNRNWGTGPGRFDPAVTSSGGRRVSPFLDNVWRRYILRLTLNQPGQAPGHGRVEVWIQRAGDPMVKIMDYLGDVGAQHQGLVHTGPSTTQWFPGGANLGWYNLTAVGGIFTGGNTLTLGYFRMWTHPREPLP